MDIITAFPEGNSLVRFNNQLKRLLVANSAGILKVFDVADPELEPISVDIIGDSCSVDTSGDLAVVSNTAGSVELVDLITNQSTGVIYRSELPVRDAVLLSGNRVACGGGDGKLVICGGGNDTVEIPQPDCVVNLAYSHKTELLAVALSNGSVAIYSTVNVTPDLIHTLNDVIPQKMHMSLDVIDYAGDHADELVCTRPQWTHHGDALVVATADNEVAVFSRADGWGKSSKGRCGTCHDLHVFDGHIATVGPEGITVFDTGSGARKAVVSSISDAICLNLFANGGDIYVGSSAGDVFVAKNTVSSSSSAALFVDEEAANSDDELIAEEDTNGFHYNEDADMLGDDDLFEEPPAKRQRVATVMAEELRPYSPGSTPWSLKGSENDRRYMAMNSVGYAWCNKTDNVRQSITVSFFDHNVHHDYHFVDGHGHDLCSLNATGVVLAKSGFDSKEEVDNGVVYYRPHDAESDAWERKFPLLIGEYITSIAVSAGSKRRGRGRGDEDSIIVAGTSFGYIRVYNVDGVALTVLKSAPVMALMASAQGIMVSVHQVGQGYTYSVVDTGDDYRYLQQDRILPISAAKGDAPIIKGMFFTDLGDPCVVAGSDDALLILHSWRESGNARWVPLLNCYHAVSQTPELSDDDETAAIRANWKCWPLGVVNDQLHCIVLKHASVYPGFPLPLPIELEIKIPVDTYKHGNRTATAAPEEEFIRAYTLGKMMSDYVGTVAEEVDTDELIDKLQQYSAMFDKSLLVMFGEACKESRLTRALSMAKMIKTDRALQAAVRIAERMEFQTLASKINDLRSLLDED